MASARRRRRERVTGRGRGLPFRSVSRRRQLQPSWLQLPKALWLPNRHDHRDGCDRVCARGGPSRFEAARDRRNPQKATAAVRGGRLAAIGTELSPRTEDGIAAAAFMQPPFFAAAVGKRGGLRKLASVPHLATVPRGR